MKRTAIRTFAALFCVLFAASCSVLPRGAAVSNEIIGEADNPDAGFAVYPVTRAFLPTVTHWPSVGSQNLSWIAHSHGARARAIQGGDRLSVTIWDSSENSLLTSAEQRVVDLREISVASNGTIFVPYIGRVNVAGRSSESARTLIQRRMEEIVPSAQVQISHSAGRSNSVDLVGGVNKPGPYPLPDNNFTVLSLIAAGGGVAGNITNPQIRLIRRGGIYGTSIDKLYANPRLDTLLRGGDQIIVEEDRRYFLSLGAAGTEALHPFTKDDVSAMDAVSIVGGVNDFRGDPKGILLLREYPAEAIRPGVRGPREPRVVFAIDLTTPDGLFSARKFHIQSGDLIYVSESPLNSTKTILGLVGSVFGIANTINNASD